MGAPELSAGQRYGRYKILEPLGEGTFANVYRVYAPQLRGVAALKLSKVSLGNSDEAQRSLREVAVLRTLESKHVVRIHDSGYGEDGRVFILMEYLQGAQLDRYHDFDTPMAPGQAIWMIHQACLGLAEAHSHGIVHRDIKPENIWVEPDQNVKVIDFGLARAWDASRTIGANVTVGHVLVGTPRYMQPEQLESGLLTPSSDVYSLATILYELLTGRSVFFADLPFTQIKERLRDNPVPWLEAHARAPPVPLTRYAVAKELPQALLDLIEQSLDKFPQRRPEDAGRLATKLGSILHYDFGVAMAAMLRITHPWGGYEDHLLLPGSHRIGSGPHCEFQLQHPSVKRIHAVLDWAGMPAYPQLRPLTGDGSITVGGQPIQHLTQLSDKDGFGVGPFAVQLTYPSA